MTANAIGRAPFWFHAAPTRGITDRAWASAFPGGDLCARGLNTRSTWRFSAFTTPMRAIIVGPLRMTTRRRLATPSPASAHSTEWSTRSKRGERNPYAFPEVDGEVDDCDREDADPDEDKQQPPEMGDAAW